MAKGAALGSVLKGRGFSRAERPRFGWSRASALHLKPPFNPCDSERASAREESAVLTFSEPLEPSPKGGHGLSHD